VPRFNDIIRQEAREALERPVLAAFLLLLFVSLAFLALPDLDLWVSRLFYDPATGFLDRRYGFVETIRDLGQLAEWALAIAAILPFPLKVLLPDLRLPIRPRKALFVLTSLALGPGLIVNGILKSDWGRARPRQLVDFGGDAAYTPVWWLSDACHRNCSFVSGEGASAFWLLAVVVLVPKEWRWPVGVVTFLFAALVSLMRVMAGGHFLSDVLVAWVITLLVLLLCHRVFIRGLPANFDDTIEGALARLGSSLRQRLRA